MTTLTPEFPMPVPGTAPQPVPDVEVGGPSGPATGQPVQKGRRRRKVALLLLLTLAVTIVAGVTGWYLVTRKPISQLPLPAITNQHALPHFVFSLYGVQRPTGVAVNASGDRIYVTDTDGDRVVRIYDSKGGNVGTITPPENAVGDHVPVYVAVDPIAGDVYVSDRIAGTIYVYNSEGVFRREFTPPADLKGWQPLGIGFDTAGNVYVTDVSGPFHRVHEFARDGSLVRTIGKAGLFNFPNGVAVDATGLIYVTDSNDGRMFVFDQEGRQKAVVGRGQKQGELGMPRGIAIDDTGTVYVVDTSGYSIQLYSTLGTDQRQPAYLGTFGQPGSIEGAFSFPNGIAVDARARVYVTDSGNNRVQVWSY